MSLQLNFWHRSALAIALAGVLAASLAWLSVRDPNITFLPRDGRAEWILFPSAPENVAHHIADLDTVFRRVLRLESQPSSARLSVRAVKRVELKINGRPVDLGASRNWKEPSSADVLACMRAGTNTIEAKVFNDNGPPALWLALTTDQPALRSDQTWEASYAGSAWRQAALASAPRMPGRGNPVAGGETTLSALGAVWPIWVVFAALALAIWTTGGWWLNRVLKLCGVGAGGAHRRVAIAVLLVIAALWIVLFCHNARLLPRVVGFDAKFHIDYIGYIQKNWSLPLPNQGWETYQPPLYYGVSALLLSPLGLTATDESGVTVLRLLATLVGVAHLALIFLSLRLLLPGRTGPQLAGLALAGFLPMHLYLSHYVTNETLAAALVTGAIYLCLRLLQLEDTTTARCAGLGLCLGAAMLAKVTGVLLVPFVALALAGKLAARRSPIAVWLRTLGVTLAAAFAVCGWYYLRLWLRFGTPLVGNWDTAIGYLWWQDHGYHTAADYVRFGRAITSPLFSGFAGFTDGIYSTLWGDGLCGGVRDLSHRPPWNYNLMAAGYLLALVPTLTILSGAATALWRFIRRPSAGWFVLLGLSGTVAFGLIFMSLRVPSYAQAKAFYGLCALLPLCFYGAVGWEALTRGRKWLQGALGTVLLVWALNSFASVWIRGDSTATHICRGLRLADEGRTEEAAVEFGKAIDADPSSGPARRFLAMTLEKSGHLNEALQQAERAVAAKPTDAACHLQIAAILAGQDHAERAITEARHAIELGPEHTTAYASLSLWLVASGRDEEAVTVARDGLAVAPGDPDLHYALGVALVKKGDFATATNHFACALLLRPDWADARLNFGLVLLNGGAFSQARVHLEAYLHQNPSDARAHHLLALALLRSGNSAQGLKELREAARLAPDSPATINELAWLLATHSDDALRNGPEAVRLAEHACAMTGRKIPVLLGTLAAAYAEAGRFPDAINAVGEAISLALSSGNKDTAALGQDLLASFQAGRAYRQKATRQ